MSSPRASWPGDIGVRGDEVCAVCLRCAVVALARRWTLAARGFCCQTRQSLEMWRTPHKIQRPAGIARPAGRVRCGSSACGIRTRDLRLERAVSLATRRMRRRQCRWSCRQRHSEDYSRAPSLGATARHPVGREQRAHRRRGRALVALGLECHTSPGCLVALHRGVKRHVRAEQQAPHKTCTR